MKLVENWKSAWKWYSIHIMVVIVALPEIWGYFPQEFKDYIKFLEDELETRIGIISIGPDREQTIEL